MIAAIILVTVLICTLIFVYIHLYLFDIYEKKNSNITTWLLHRERNAYHQTLISLYSFGMKEIKEVDKMKDKVISDAEVAANIDIALSKK